MTMTAEQCERRIAALVREVGLSESGMRECANLYLLDARETAALQEIDGLRYLLGGVQKPCDHADLWFDRSICPEPCGSMHERCNACGETLGHCRLEGDRG